MKSFLLAISGPTAAGKTYFTNKLIGVFEENNLSTIRISTDEFYKDLSHLQMEERIKVNYDLPQSIDIEEFSRALRQLHEGHSTEIPVYDFSTHTRKSETRMVNPAIVIIVEGIFSLAFPEINSLYNLKIFIDLDQDLRLIRRVRRDLKERGRNVESVFNQYINQVRPAQDQYVIHDRERADIILHGNKNHHNIYQLLKDAVSYHISWKPK